MDLEDDIPSQHVVCVVHEAVNRLDDQIFKDAYPGGGRDSYHPKMLTKVIIYDYTQRIYSSRQIAKAVRENVMFMWIAGRQRPDFRTINRFRSERMKDVLETVFTAVLQLLADEKYVKLEHYFVDGTKIEGREIAIPAKGQAAYCFAIKVRKEQIAVMKCENGTTEARPAKVVRLKRLVQKPKETGKSA